MPNPNINGFFPASVFNLPTLPSKDLCSGFVGEYAGGFS